MPRICYASRQFSPANRLVIRQANEIIQEYAAQGFDLTLRQLYYQFVSRDLLSNTVQSYKRLGSIINDARLAGLIDWETIVDRTRNLRSLPHWRDPASIIDACSRQFRVDKWAEQEYRPEVWIEKDALVGVIEGVCEELDVPFFSCRGYTSQSEMWSAGQRLIGHCNSGQTPFIIHLGDHDPSGIDMSRDIFDRLQLFMEYHGHDAAEVRRMALNMDQVEQYDPPPNPAKLTDSRSNTYVEEYGYESWELDALEPVVMADLIREAVEGIRDEDAWTAAVDRENEHQAELESVASQWSEVLEFLEEQRD